MKHNVVAPEVGESITEVSILAWNKADGDQVTTGEVILEIESDKATVEIIAEADGALKILKQQGETIPVNSVVGEIDDSAKGNVSASSPQSDSPSPSAASSSTPTPASMSTGGGTTELNSGAVLGVTPPMSPSMRKTAIEKGDDLTKPSNGNGSSKGSSPGYSAPSAKPAPKGPTPGVGTQPGDRRVPLSRLRQKIAERLVGAQHESAILTTFNELNMNPLLAFRSKRKGEFKEKHGLPMSIMSFFTRAAVKALELHPDINASIDGTDIIYHDYYNIGIAVGTDRGLVVPVVRDAGKLSFLETDQTIVALAEKARSGKLSIADMSGGTFTVSNGGTYGSMLSTPILNPPQSGILGMHATKNRAVVNDGKVEIAPMMYLALSYDHRIIDGKGAVTFLVDLIKFLEDPQSLGIEE